METGKIKNNEKKLLPFLLLCYIVMYHFPL